MEYMAYIRRLREMKVMSEEMMRMVRDRLKNLRMVVTENSRSVDSVRGVGRFWTGVEPGGDSNDQTIDAP